MTSKELSKTVEVYFQERSAWLHTANASAEQVIKYLDKIEAISGEYLNTVSTPEVLSSLSNEEIDKYAEMELQFIESFRDKYPHINSMYDKLNTFWGHL